MVLHHAVEVLAMIIAAPHRFAHGGYIFRGGLRKQLDEDHAILAKIQKDQVFRIDRAPVAFRCGGRHGWCFGQHDLAEHDKREGGYELLQHG